jgi:hypothetical protein
MKMYEWNKTNGKTANTVSSGSLLRGLVVENYFKTSPLKLRHYPFHGLYTEMPFGQLPVLQIDGSVKIAQSMAIARFLAREFSLY